MKSTRPNIEGKVSFLNQIGSLGKLILALLIAVASVSWSAAIIYSKKAEAIDKQTKAFNELQNTVTVISADLDSLKIDVKAWGENTILIGNTMMEVDQRNQNMYKAFKEDLKTRKDMELQHYIRLESILDEGLKKNEAWIHSGSQGF